MPSRGLHGPSRKKITKARPDKPLYDTDPPVPDNERMITLLIAIANSLARIEERMTPQRSQALDQLDPPPRIGPSGLPGGDQEFISGQWHRRAGDVYARVAEPGSPNAGKTVGETFGSKHDDDTSGSV